MAIMENCAKRETPDAVRQKIPHWLENIVFYEIYPQSFLDTDGDGIGNIQGIIRKLDYIKGLGCDGIWLNPCFASPFYDAGYDVSDYKRVAPRYGTNEDLKELFAEAHARGMRVLLDLVPGHTSVEHAWFKESARAEKNEYTDRYVWTDNIWEDCSGVGSISGSLRGFSDRNGCCGVNFYTIQPALNYGFARRDRDWQQAPDAPGPMATREAMKDVMRFWMSMGCDGFRVDMAGSLIKNDDNQEGTIALWQDFRRFMDEEFPDCAMISEWGDPERSLRGGFHMDFLLHFGPSHYLDLFREEEPYFSRRGKGDVSEFVKTYNENYGATNRQGLICIPSGNHDMVRIRETLDEEEMKLAFAFLLSMPGAPFIYYGDEIGMRYLSGIRSVEGGFHRTGSRSPMQWDHTANAGFSSCPPEDLYIAVDPDKDRPTVEDALAGKNSLFDEVKKLIAVRKEHQALQNVAPMEFVYAQKEAYPLVYKRTGTDETVLIVLNPSGREANCRIDISGAREVIYSCGGAASLKDGELSVPAASATFFRI